MIKVVFTKQRRIQLVPDDEESEETLRIFALNMGIEEGDSYPKHVVASLTSPIISGGRKLSRRTLHLLF